MGVSRQESARSSAARLSVLRATGARPRLAARAAAAILRRPRTAIPWRLPVAVALRRTCGIEFEPAEFPFVAHCTLTQPPNPAPTDPTAPELQLDAEFTADTLSVYQIEAFPLLTLRYRGYLQGSI